MTFRIIQAFLLSLAASAVSSVGLPRSPVTNAGPHSRLWSESSLIDDEGFLTNAFGGIPGDWESLTTLPLEAEAANSDANSDAARSSIDTYPKLVELIPHSQFSIPNNSTTSIRGAFRSKPMNFTNYYNPFSKTYPYSTLGSAPSEKEMKNSPSSPKPLPSNAIYPNKRICLILPNPPTTLKRNPLSLLSDAEGRPPQSLGGLYDSSKMGWTKSGDIGYFQGFDYVYSHINRDAIFGKESDLRKWREGNPNSRSGLGIFSAVRRRKMTKRGMNGGGRGREGVGRGGGGKGEVLESSSPSIFSSSSKVEKERKGEKSEEVDLIQLPSPVFRGNDVSSPRRRYGSPYKIRQVPGDGNCLFHALSCAILHYANNKLLGNSDQARHPNHHQSHPHLNDPTLKGGALEMRALSKQLREMAVEELRLRVSQEERESSKGVDGGASDSNPSSSPVRQFYHRMLAPFRRGRGRFSESPNLYLQQTVHLPPSTLLSSAASQYNLTVSKYLSDMATSNTWGGGPEIVALVNRLRRPIHVYELVSTKKPPYLNAVGRRTEAAAPKEGGEAVAAFYDISNKFFLRRLAAFGSPLFDETGNGPPLCILSADCRFPNIKHGEENDVGNHFLAIFPGED